jgi:hypothetical protein
VKEDFYDWKKHPITEVVFSTLKARMEYLQEEMVEQASTVSQAELAEKAGAIKAIRDLLNITVAEFTQETDE